MSKLFITGDIHGDLEINRLASDKFPAGKELTKNDYVIICGDFGLIWNYKGMSKEEEYWLNWLKDKPWTTLFVDGNHENFVRLNDYKVEEWNGGKVHKINDSVIHLMRGQVYDLCGKKIFTYGGAESTDRIYRVEFKSWWPQETPTREEYNEAIDNLSKADFKVDYIFTHDMPSDYKRKLFYSPKISPNSTPYQLNDFNQLCEYRDWYCGHYHIDVDIENNFHMLYKKIVEVTL